MDNRLIKFTSLEYISLARFLYRHYSFCSIMFGIMIKMVKNKDSNNSQVLVIITIVLFSHHQNVNIYGLVVDLKLIYPPRSMQSSPQPTTAIIPRNSLYFDERAV